MHRLLTIRSRCIYNSGTMPVSTAGSFGVWAEESVFALRNIFFRIPKKGLTIYHICAIISTAE